MLQELSIKNFAIIDEVTVSFTNGMTVLTGETGAGKSIIIDAVNLLVGGRGSAQFVRYGEQKAEIEGLFYLQASHPCHKKLKEYGIDIEEGMLVLRREISSNGKSVCRVNGKLMTISILRELGSTLVDIHGQHEHQQLMNEYFHISLLDQFGQEEIFDALKAYKAVYKEYEEVHNKLSELNTNEQQLAQRLDLLQFQLQEITGANLQLNEDVYLEEEKNCLDNFEDIFKAIHSGYEGLQGEGRGLDFVGHVMSHLEAAVELDERYKPLEESVANCFYMLEDVTSSLRNELELLEFNPERQNEVEFRLNEINQLKRKYGATVDEILEYSSQVEEEIEMIQNRDSRVEELEKRLVSLHEDLLLEANQLSNVRKKWASKLEKAIHNELEHLYMDKAIFQIHFQSKKESDDGIDHVQFQISTNPGEPLKPLSKVASGGELSRMMLALKTIFTKHQGTTSIIFDEVDTGVSGRIAQAMAEKIQKISVDSQVLCISHLPQVAAMADTHLLISKKISGQRTQTIINQLNKKEKIKEISRMISGAEITEITKKHASELLEVAYTLKIT